MRGLLVFLLCYPAMLGARGPDFVLRGDGEWVNALSGAREVLVAGSDKGKVRMWSLDEKPLVRRELGAFASPVTALLLKDEGGSLLVGTWNGRLVSLDPANGRVLRKYEEHRETITTLKFSPDGKYFASGSADDRFLVWDAGEGEVLLEMHQGNEYDVTTLAFSPDGKTIATGDGENQIRLWDAETGEAIKILNGHLGPVSALSYGPEGMLVSGSWDKSIRLWSGEKPTVLQGHEEGITGLKVVGDRLFSASEDGTVRVWSLKTRKVLQVLRGSSNLRCLEVMRNGRLVLAGTKGKILGWRLN